MPEILPQLVTRVTASGPTGSGDRWNNVFHVLGGADNETKTAIVRGRFQTFYSSMQAANVFPQGWGVDNYAFTFQAGAATSRIDMTGSIAQPGGTNEPLPNQIAIVISWRTAFSGRSYRGRTYVGPCAVAARGPNAVIATAQRDAILAAAQALRTGLSTDQYSLVVYSRKLFGASPITSALVGPYFDTQRRRRSVLRG